MGGHHRGTDGIFRKGAVACGWVLFWVVSKLFE